MRSFISPFVVALTSLAVTNAAKYCQCENDENGRIFPGINQVCSGLSNDWCSTNCAAARLNCDYCQWTPAGPEPEEDYAQLLSWCQRQEGGDASTGTYYGNAVNCYSYDNKASCGYCFGCSYASTSFYKRDELYGSSTLIERQGSDKDPNRAPHASVTLESSILGIPIGGNDCFDIFPIAAQQVSDHFTTVYPDSCRSKNTGDDFVLKCDFVELLLGSNSVSADFDKLCSDYGGHDAPVDGEGDIRNPHEPSDPDQ